MVRTGVGAEAQRKALRLLRGILQRAVEWKRLPTNEARLVRLPSPRDTRAVRPLPPETVEAMRDHFVAQGRPADAVLVSLLAYAGLRPQEAHALCWHHVRGRTLLIEQRVTNGVIRRSTKNRQNRAVRMLAPVAQDLREFRLSHGRPGDKELILPARDGRPWNQWARDHWRGRAFKAAKEAVGADDATPYTLRHSFASLLIWEGRPITYVAGQLGHSPTMTLRTYAHVFEELEDAERTSAEEAIQRARWITRGDNPVVATSVFP